MMQTTDRLRKEVLELVGARLGMAPEDVMLLGVQGSVACYNDKTPAVCEAVGRRLAQVAATDAHFELIVGGSARGRASLPTAHHCPYITIAHRAGDHPWDSPRRRSRVRL